MVEAEVETTSPQSGISWNELGRAEALIASYGCNFVFEMYVVRILEPQSAETVPAPINPLLWYYTLDSGRLPEKIPP